MILISTEKKKPSELAQKESFLFKIISYNQAWRTDFTLAVSKSKENFFIIYWSNMSITNREESYYVHSIPIKVLSFV